MGIHSPCSKRKWPTHADSLPGDHSRELLVERTSALDGQHIPILSVKSTSASWRNWQKHLSQIAKEESNLTNAFIYYVTLKLKTCLKHKHTHMHTFCSMRMLWLALNMQRCFSQQKCYHPMLCAAPRQQRRGKEMEPPAFGDASGMDRCLSYCFWH